MTRPKPGTDRSVSSPMNKAIGKRLKHVDLCDKWGLLRGFRFIVSEGGMTRAARAQGLSQP
mgnify:CR=1 FL=1